MLQKTKKIPVCLSLFEDDYRKFKEVYCPKFLSNPSREVTKFIRSKLEEVKNAQ